MKVHIISKPEENRKADSALVNPQTNRLDSTKAFSDPKTTEKVFTVMREFLNFLF